MVSKKKRKFLGITLVELLLIVAISAPLLYVISKSYFNFFGIFLNQDAKIELESQVRIAIDAISNDVRKGTAFTENCTPCGGTSSGANVLVLQLWPINSSGEPINPQGTNFDYYVYSENAQKIIRSSFPSAISSRNGGQDILVSNVSSPLEFTYDGASPQTSNVVIITIEAQKTLLGKTVSTTQTKEAKLRNK